MESFFHACTKLSFRFPSSLRSEKAVCSCVLGTPASGTSNKDCSQPAVSCFTATNITWILDIRNSHEEKVGGIVILKDINPDYTCCIKLMISVDIILMTFRQQINSKQNGVQSVHLTSTSTRNSQGPAHKLHKVSITGVTGANCQQRKM